MGKIIRQCEFSPDRAYRYTLWREWGTGWFDERDRGVLMVIGLNPSTADETKNDPTIRRCIKFATDWGFSALCMTNLFAYRATKPKDMWDAPAPVGQDNDKWLGLCAAEAGMVLAAWGTQPGQGLPLRAGIVMAGLQAVYCLGTTADGMPRHPLYVRGDAAPIEYFDV